MVMTMLIADHAHRHTDTCTQTDIHQRIKKLFIFSTDDTIQFSSEQSNKLLVNDCVSSTESVEDSRIWPRLSQFQRRYWLTASAILIMMIQSDIPQTNNSLYNTNYDDHLWNLTENSFKQFCFSSGYNNSTESTCKSIVLPYEYRNDDSILW